MNFNDVAEKMGEGFEARFAVSKAIGEREFLSRSQLFGERIENIGNCTLPEGCRPA